MHPAFVPVIAAAAVGVLVEFPVTQRARTAAASSRIPARSRASVIDE